MSTTGEHDKLELDSDEAEHQSLVDDDVISNIAFSSDAAKISMHGLIEMDDRPPINTPKQFVWFLLAKCSQNLRLACHGIELGYYSGTYSLLRSALESLAYAVLFHDDEHEVRIWLRNEFSDNDTEMARIEQTGRARAALRSQEQRVIKKETYKFQQAANSQIHATLKGIASEFDMEVETLFPDDFEEAFAKAGEDFQQALDIYLETDSFQSITANPTYSDQVPEDAVWLKIGCRYDQATAGS